MLGRMKLVSLLITVACLCLPMIAHAEDDTEGCKDSETITRMSGSWIAGCDHKEFDQMAVAAKGPDGGRVDKQLEGEIWYWQYRTRDGVSALQEFRNVQNAVQSAGLKTTFAQSGDTLTAQKGNTWLFFEFYDGSYNQYVIQVKEMKQEMTADASQLQGELESSGHVAVYGIHFDTGKSNILPDSEPVLNQILKLLESDANLKLSIEGHTDNQGQKAANQTLSEKRAQAVVGWLVAHGVDASRLSAKGFGDSKPVADNSTEENRAKNRRVELVKP